MCKGVHIRPRRFDWSALREKWIIAKVDGSSMNLKEFAAREGVAHMTVKQHASREKWTQLVEQRRRERDELVAKVTMERSAEAIGSVRNALATTEAEVRERHARYARYAQNKALAKLNKLSIDELTAQQAIELLRLGLSEERKALGLPDEYVVQDGTTAVIVSRAQEAFEQRLLSDRRVESQLAKALKIVEGEFTVAGTDRQPA